MLPCVKLSCVKWANTSTYEWEDPEIIASELEIFTHFAPSISASASVSRIEWTLALPGGASPTNSSIPTYKTKDAKGRSSKLQLQGRR